MNWKAWEKWLGMSFKTTLKRFSKDFQGFWDICEQLSLLGSVDSSNSLLDFVCFHCASRKLLIVLLQQVQILETLVAISWVQPRSREHHGKKRYPVSGKLFRTNCGGMYLTKILNICNELRYTITIYCICKCTWICIMSLFISKHIMTYYHDMLYHTTSYHIKSCHISFDIISYRIISYYYFLSYHIILNHIVYSYHIIKL